jgi:hypothetical protein
LALGPGAGLVIRRPFRTGRRSNTDIERDALREFDHVFRDLPSERRLDIEDACFGQTGGGAANVLVA